MREADWELQKYERLKPLIVDVIKAHASMAIFNMQTGELTLCRSVQEYIDKHCHYILRGIPSILIEPFEGHFRVMLDSELVIKKEYYKADVFETDYEYIIEDHPELQFDPEAFAESLTKALVKAMNSN